MSLFGCEYREGKAASAPLLRPHGNDREGGHPADDPLPTFIADLKCEPHDPNELPHLHSADDIQRLFPSIDAAPEPANSKDYKVDGGVFLSSDPVHPWLKHTRVGDTNDPDHPWLKLTRVGDIGSADRGVKKRASP